MDIGIEAWELLVEHAGKPQVLHDRFVEAFAGDEQGDTGWVGGQQDGRRAAFELIDRNAIDFVVGHHGKGVGGFHRRLHRREVHLGRHASHIVGLVGVMDPLAEILESNPFVLRVLLNELGEDFPHRLVLVVIVFELLQGADQGVPSSFGDSDGEHDEERVEACFLDDHTVFGQIACDDRGGDSRFGELARDIESWGHDGGFDRIEHVEAIGELAKAVPVLVPLEDPVFALTDAFFDQLVRSPDFEPPVGAPFVVDFPHGASEIDRFHDRFLDQCGSAGGFHHGRCDVARGDDRILR